VTCLDSFPASLQVAYQAVRLNQSGLCKNGLPPVMKLDGGTSLVCSVGVIGEVVRCLVGEIGGALGMGGMGGVKH